MATPESRHPEVYGLTGGMGSGKSTVAKRFKTNGAHIVDADQVVHDLQEPGSPMLGVMSEVLGGDIVVDGRLDRTLVADRIFSDRELNSRLKAAMYPSIFAEIDSRAARAAPSETVIFDTPILDPAIQIGGRALSGVVVVDTPVDLAVERLREGRGISKDEASRRLSHQISREERLGFADYVITNDGSLEHLHEQVDEVWRRIRTARVSGAVAIGGCDDS